MVALSAPPNGWQVIDRTDLSAENPKFASYRAEWPAGRYQEVRATMVQINPSLLNTNLRLQLRRGATWIGGAADYETVQDGILEGSNSSVQENAQPSIALNRPDLNPGFDAESGYWGHAVIQEPDATGPVSVFLESRILEDFQTPARMSVLSGGGWCLASPGLPVTGLEIFASQGVLNAGIIKVEGRLK